MSSINAETKEVRTAFLKKIGQHCSPGKSFVKEDGWNGSGVRLEIESTEKVADDPLKTCANYQIKVSFRDFEEETRLTPYIELNLRVWPLEEGQSLGDGEEIFLAAEAFNRDEGVLGEVYGSDEWVGAFHRIPCLCKTEQEYTDLLPYLFAAIDALKAEANRFLKETPLPAIPQEE